MGRVIDITERLAARHATRGEAHTDLDPTRHGFAVTDIAQDGPWRWVRPSDGLIVGRVRGAPGWVFLEEDGALRVWSMSLRDLLARHAAATLPEPEVGVPRRAARPLA